MMSQGHQPAMVLVAPDTSLANYPQVQPEMQAAALKPNILNSGAVVVIPANYGRAGGIVATGGARSYPELDPYGPTNFDPYNPTYVLSPAPPASGIVRLPSPGFVLAQQDHPTNQPIGPVVGPPPNATATLATLVQETSPEF
jgi:hypothetical protein